MIIIVIMINAIIITIVIMHGMKNKTMITLTVVTLFLGVTWSCSGRQVSRDRTQGVKAETTATFL